MLRMPKVVIMHANVKEYKKDLEIKEALDEVLTHVYENRKYYSIAYAVALNAMAGPVYAASGGMSGGLNLIKLIQKGSFWIGMGVSMWGIIEAQLDYPGWRGRVLKGVLGYIGILILPLIFLELRTNLQVDVWNAIENSGNGGN